MTHRIHRTRIAHWKISNKLKTSLRRAVRALILTIHVAKGLGIISLYFPHCKHSARNQQVLTWSQKLIQIFGLDLQIHGEKPDASRPALIIANHVSWMDIFALNSVSTARFVAKSEVSKWPIIGRFCKATGTIFIERNNKKDTARTNQAMTTALSTGDHIALFPEGTSSDGHVVLPFRSPLMQPALDCQVLIHPVYLQYLDEKGHITNVAAYCDEISFGKSLWALLGNEGTSISLHYLPAIQVEKKSDRRVIARQIEEEIRAKHNSVR